MGSLAPTFPTPRAPFDESPTGRVKKTCWDAFLATRPSEENQEQFWAFLDQANTTRDMRTVIVIIRFAQKCHSILDKLGPKEAKTMVEEGIVEAVHQLWQEDLSDEDFQRMYRELLPFGSAPQDVIFALLYDLNNLDGCQKRNRNRRIPNSRRWG